MNNLLSYSLLTIHYVKINAWLRFDFDNYMHIYFKDFNIYISKFIGFYRCLKSVFQLNSYKLCCFELVNCFLHSNQNINV